MVIAPAIVLRLAQIEVLDCEFTSIANLLAQATESAVNQLDPVMRAKVLASMAGLIILAVTMVLLAWLGGRAARRYMASRTSNLPSKTRLDPDDWARKPLNRD